MPNQEELSKAAAGPNLVSKLVVPGGDGPYVINADYVKGQDADTWVGGKNFLVLNEQGKIPSELLPAGVDQVAEIKSFDLFPIPGATDIIYIDLSTNKTYRWSGTKYVEISASLALGYTSGTAAHGDHTHTLTPKGNVNSTFNGTAAKATASYTPDGDITVSTTKPSGNTGNYTPTGKVTINPITPSGSVSGSFTGKEATISSSFTPAGTISKISHTPAGTVSISKAVDTSGKNVNYTPEGTISVTETQAGGSVSSSFKGEEATIKLTQTPVGTISKISYTPEGTVSTPTITVKPATTTIKTLKSAGTHTSVTSSDLTSEYDNGSKTLTLSFTKAVVTPGTDAKYGEQAVMTGATATSSQPTFTGTPFEITPTFTGTQKTISTSYTPKGSVSSTFTGTPHTHTASFSGKGAVLEAKFSGTPFSVTPTFSGTSGTATATYTPEGSISATFKGNAVTPIGTFVGDATQINGSFTGTAATIKSDYTPVGTITSSFAGLSTTTSAPTVK